MSQAPACQSLARPSWPLGRTTTTVVSAVVLTIAASEDAIAENTCCQFHNGGKTTAITSEPGRG